MKEEKNVVTSQVKYNAAEIAKEHGFTLHEAAEIFDMQRTEEIQALAEDIKTHGQRVPIATQDKKILDGRNRLVACKIVGVVPKFVEVTGDPVEQIVSLNLLRRNLDESERAMMALQLLPKLKNETGKKLTKVSDSGRLTGKLSKRVAEMLGVGERIIERLQSIEKYTPGRLSELESGEKKIGQVHDDLAANRTLVKSYCKPEWDKLEAKAKDGHPVAEEFAKLVKVAEEKKKEADEKAAATPKQPRDSLLIWYGNDVDTLLKLQEQGKGRVLVFKDDKVPTKDEAEPFVKKLKDYELVAA